MSFIGISAGIGAATSIGKIATGLHQNHLANQIHPDWQGYVSSPYAARQLGLGQQLFNGRMAGATAEQQNIGNAQANQQSNINQNATDSSQALSLGQQSQNTADKGYNNLGIEEAKNKYNLLDNLNSGYQAMVNEGNKVYQSNLEKYQMDTQQQAGLRGAGFQNIFSGASDLGSQAALLAQNRSQNKNNGDMLSMLGSMYGNSGGSNNQPSISSPSSGWGEGWFMPQTTG